jgi:hypothetical protein
MDLVLIANHLNTGIRIVQVNNQQQINMAKRVRRLHHTNRLYTTKTIVIIRI